MELLEPANANNMEAKKRRLHFQAESLFADFEKGGRGDKLEEAITLDRKALELSPPGHPERQASLMLLQRHLWKRYLELGTSTDIGEAISLAQEALGLCPQGHPNRPMCLNHISLGFYSHYQGLGQMPDLDEAIVLARESLNLCPRDHPHRFLYLNTLAVPVSNRYHQLGGIADLDEAIVLQQEALELCCEGHPKRSIILNNLAVNFSSRFVQSRAMQDLDQALIFAREALWLCPQGHPDRPTRLNTLGSRLFIRFEQLGTLADLHEAIELGREALHRCPRGHPDLPNYLNSVSLRLVARYWQLRRLTDLNEAITLGEEALPLRPLGHPRRSRSLSDLASFLKIRFTHFNRSKDLLMVFDLYAELSYLPQMVSSAALSAAKAWVQTAEYFHHPTTLPAYETSLRLLVQYLSTLPSLPQHLPTLKQLASSLAVDAFSACLRSRQVETAIELLEQGRGVFWNQIARLRSPLDDVIASGSEGKLLADKFTSLTSQIRDATNSSGSDQHDQLCHLNLEIQKVVNNIRELPGLARFHLPPLFSDLRQAGSCGPVIILNASKYGCDALVVFLDHDPVHIPLEITRDRVRGLSLEVQSLTVLARSMDVARNFVEVLREIWDKVVSPISDFLEKKLPARSRIWWCPTAEFSLLPLHAVGPYRPNLSHLYISSYTPTLTALIRARRPHPSTSRQTRKHFVCIGQAQAPDETELFSVGSELANIGQLFDGLVAFSCIEGPEACVLRVNEELVKNEWVHLACHGLPDPQHPFDSAFALQDGHFTIQHIMQCELENAEFAYLSACHTTVGDEESPDEVIHLASAMQFAGFRL